MSAPIFQVALRTERDVVQARQRAREVAAALGLDNQDQIRMATATSEIARNAFRYARNGCGSGPFTNFRLQQRQVGL